MVDPPCCHPADTDLLACLEAAERNILPHHGLGEPVGAVTEGRTMRRQLLIAVGLVVGMRAAAYRQSMV